jgi:hypothetical protein
MGSPATSPAASVMASAMAPDSNGEAEFNVELNEH